MGSRGHIFGRREARGMEARKEVVMKIWGRGDGMSNLSVLADLYPF